MSVLLDKILNLSLTTLPEVTALSSESVVTLLFAQQLLANLANWLDTAEDQADRISPADAVEIERLVSNAMYEIMHPLVGVVMPYTTIDPPTGTLICDGSVYLRVDYPELYIQLDDAFIIDADSFFVPDLRDLTIVGVSSSRVMGATGGEETVTLTTDQMPTHSHENAPHTHSEGIAIPAIINGGLEAPASAAIPSSGITGASSITIADSGGGQAHNNMQPFIALKYCIGAG